MIPIFNQYYTVCIRFIELIIEKFHLSGTGKLMARLQDNDDLQYWKKMDLTDVKYDGSRSNEKALSRSDALDGSRESSVFSGPCNPSQSIFQLSWKGSTCNQRSFLGRKHEHSEYGIPNVYVDRTRQPPETLCTTST